MSEKRDLERERESAVEREEEKERERESERKRKERIPCLSTQPRKKSIATCISTPLTLTHPPH